MKRIRGKGLTETKLVPGKSMDEIDRESFGAGPAPMDSRATTIALRTGSAEHPAGAPRRPARQDGRYWLAIVPGEFVQFPQRVMVRKGSTVTPEWPIAFTRLQCPADDFLARFPCNHIHGCYGDWTRELLHAAERLGIEARVFE
jgi:hypothetical protein